MDQVIITAVFVGVGLLIREAVAAVIRSRAARADIVRRDAQDAADRQRQGRQDAAGETRQERRDTLQSLREYIKLRDADFDELKKEFRDYREDSSAAIADERRKTEECNELHAVAQRFRERAEAWNYALVMALRREGITVPDYNPEAGTGQHPPVEFPPGGGS